MSWGANQKEWAAFAALSLRDLRPCCMNPHRMTLPTKAQPESVKAGKRFTKTPSRLYGDEGLVAGMPAWQTINATEKDLQLWSAEPDLGVGLVGRAIKAIDIDIDDEELADELDEVICDWFDAELPARQRPGTPRRLLLFRFDVADEGRKKQIIRPDKGGMVEFLFDRCFFVLAGTHHSGRRQTFEKLPTLDDIPTISPERLEELLSHLRADYGDRSAPTSQGYDPDEPRAMSQVKVDAPEYQHVVNSEWFVAHLPDGKVSVKCPWGDTHTTDDHGDLTKTVFMPEGLGGATFCGFNCQHESHGPKTGREFLDAIGFIPSEFEITEVEAQERPAFKNISSTGNIPSSNFNLRLAMEWSGGMLFRVRMDDFTGTLTISNDRQPWREFRDTDYTAIACRLEELGFSAVSDQRVKAAVHAEAEHSRVDTAQEWLRSLSWDGYDRISKFHVNVLHTKDDAYHQAVVNYLFTALAGRVLDPGCKADMVPILIGHRQGQRKSTLVACLAPTPDWFTEIDLNSRDADTSRLMRGKVIAELPELRGLATKDAESIKAWVTRTHEEWTPKFKEFSNKYPRRLLPVGTTNRARFLTDATGHRRWLPVVVCANRESHIDSEYVERHLEQLWAQAVALYNVNGIMWQDAERLALGIIHKHVKPNATNEAVRVWVQRTGRSNFTTYDVVREALHYAMHAHGAQKAVGQAESSLLSMGYVEDENGRWNLPFL